MMKKTLFTLALLLMAFMAHAATLINGIYYNLDSSTKTAEVTYGNNKYTGAVSIPSTVSYEGYSYRVTSIGYYTFYCCRNLTSVNIANSVTNIGEMSFRLCSSLTSISIPNNVAFIGRYAFYGCSSLISVIIGNGVKTIEDYTFYSCTSLSSVSIGNGVTSIGEYAFSGCKKLTSITIPNSVKSLESCAFEYCSSLSSVIIGNGLTSMGIFVFSDCTSLNSIKVDAANTSYDSRNNCNAIIETTSNTLISGCKNTIIPKSVTRIGHSAFCGCSNMTSINISNNVASIGRYAFCDCSGLTSINIPENVTKIERSAFSGCSSLTSINIPENVTKIESSAFSRCSSLTSITIPNSVSSIEDYVFNGCTALTSVTVKNPTPVTIYDYTFSNSANTTLYVPQGAKVWYLTADYWKDFKEIKENIPTVSPMLTTKWHQTSPYNNMCPPTIADGTDHSAAGCGAIAVAQILNKHRVSNHGYGHVRYSNTKTGIIDVDFSKMSFDWNKILNSYSGSYTTAQANAVASLVYQTGAGMIMSYDTLSTTKNMGMMLWGLQHHLHFSPDCRYRNRNFYSTTEWLDMLNNELLNGRPVFYRGSWEFDEQDVGHIFVVDGVNNEGKYHVNFGHGNNQDKYVDLNVINQSNVMDRPDSRAVCYNHIQAMITDFQPMGDISESAYCEHPLILTSPMVIDGNQHNKTVRKPLGSTFTLKMRIRDCSLTGGTLNFGLGVFKDGVLKQVIHHNGSNYITINGGGRYVEPNITLTLPTSLKKHVMGDVNHDNEVSVKDVADVVSYIIYNDASNFHIQQADMNKDGEITVKDVSAIVVKILNMDLHEPTAEDYEMCLVSSSNGGNSWDKIFEDAPSTINLTVDGDFATINMPTNHTLESYLYLRQEIQEVDNVMSSYVEGKAFRLALRNPSINNFENKLRLAITCNGQTTNYDLVNSIYSGCDVDFDILVPNTVVNLTGKNYQVSAYYYEANTNSYVPLTTTKPSMPSNEMMASDVEIYDNQLRLIKRIAIEDVASQYSSTMLQLGPGEYNIKENGKFRKVKMQQKLP